ncbi:hypothetical protein PoB_007444900 [Plakobranchus ocellatus]|uniref:Uncharacterized protein n=1 Tax=Plakobranchus ocellatus TaxID=259542 RepID=A0AAV4DUW3_9GAST|nr:hypothetical protein PoB_007444900 [Plakobranchus ocellatus]
MHVIWLWHNKIECSWQTRSHNSLFMDTSRRLPDHNAINILVKSGDKRPEITKTSQRKNPSQFNTSTSANGYHAGVRVPKKPESRTDEEIISKQRPKQKAKKAVYNLPSSCPVHINLEDKEEMSNSQNSEYSIVAGGGS